MMNSTIISKLKRILCILCALVFWLLLWELLSRAIGNAFLFPGVFDTSKELGIILVDPKSYLIMLYTVIRVVFGLALGIVFGFILAVLCKTVPFLEVLVSPIITVIKSTPVASFIVVLWVILSGDQLSVFIAFLMVMPIIYQNLRDGFSSIDKNLLEVCDVFGFSATKKFRLLVLPALVKYFVPAVITASGLAWKAEIAAEIIGYTKNSIGQQINDAKFFMETPKVFAWTVLIIIFSMLLEKGAKLLLKGLKARPSEV